MRPQSVITLVVLLAALCLAGLTGSWIAWAATLASAAWLAWVAADTVTRRIVDRPHDHPHSQDANRTRPLPPVQSRSR